VAPESSTEFAFHDSDRSTFPLGTKTVNITRLKRFAAEKLPRHSALSDILITEKDEIPLADFLSKLQIWLALLRRRDEKAR